MRRFLPGRPGIEEKINTRQLTQKQRCDGMEIAKKDDFIQIKIMVLEAGDRKEGIPSDTAKQPYLALVKGFLVDDEAKIGQDVTIRTPIGRLMQGKFIANNPPYGYDFGAPVPELMEVGPELHAILDHRAKGEYNK